MKNIINEVGIFALKRAAGAVTKYDKTARNEVSGWEKNFSVELVVFSTNQRILFVEKNGRLTGSNEDNNSPDLKIIIKDIVFFKKMVLAELSLADAYTQNRVIVEGNIMDAMRFVRIMNLIMSYLYPKFLLKRITAKLPVFTLKRVFIKLKVIINGLILGAL